MSDVIWILPCGRVPSDDARFHDPDMVYAWHKCAKRHLVLAGLSQTDADAATISRRYDIAQDAWVYTLTAHG